MRKGEGIFPSRGSPEARGISGKGPAGLVRIRKRTELIPLHLEELSQPLNPSKLAEVQEREGSISRKSPSVASPQGAALWQEALRPLQRSRCSPWACEPSVPHPSLPLLCPASMCVSQILLCLGHHPRSLFCCEASLHGRKMRKFWYRELCDLGQAMQSSVPRFPHL